MKAQIINATLALASLVCITGMCVAETFIACFWFTWLLIACCGALWIRRG